MKKSLIATLVTAPLLTLSSMAFASEPVQLEAAQMDSVTAGFVFVYKDATVWQSNTSPVVVNQVSAVNLFGSGNNGAAIFSGNASTINQ